jgi:DNA-directed RNA polymerase beta' subunit
MKLLQKAKARDSNSSSNIRKKNEYISAFEAASGSRVINVGDESMHIKLITDKLIENNELKVVSNPLFFDRGNNPTVDGLFSEYIFGSTNDERRTTYAYIDLKRKFFHPYVYEILKKLYKHIETIASGQGSWYIDESGSLKEIKNKSDPKYDEDNTGLVWLIENYKKIKFEENESLERGQRLKLIKSLTQEEIFITSWIVIPIFYRDVDMSTGSGSKKIPELNYDYNDLIKYTNSLGRETIVFYSNQAMFNIQITLVKIRKLGQSLIEKKSGAFHQMVLGKSIDRGSRVVISAPSMNYYEYAEDFPIDILHSGIPLARCIILGYPFVMKWVLDFFDRELGSKSTKTLYIKDSKTGESRMEEVDIEDQSSIFTEEYIKKKMKNFINTTGGRFEPVKIKLVDGRETNMIFTGRGYSRDLKNPLSSTIVNRPMTWTDIFYLASIETLSDKHVYITR